MTEINVEDKKLEDMSADELDVVIDRSSAEMDVQWKAFKARIKPVIALRDRRRIEAGAAAMIEGLSAEQREVLRQQLVAQAVPTSTDVAAPTAPGE